MTDAPEINRPETIAEVQAVFDRYERALVSNDVATLEAMFWDDPEVIRYGASENLYGAEDLRAFRRTRSGAGLARDLVRVEIRSFGTDFATTHAEFTRAGSKSAGRQSQTLVRFPGIGWLIVSAHVSVMAS